MNLLQPERLDCLAREYALGTLAGPARRRFERLLAQSGAARLAVGAWQDRLAPLADAIAPVQPRPAVWKNVEARLFASRAAPVQSVPAPSGAWSWLAGLLSPRVLGSALAGALLCVLLLRQEPGWIGMEPQRETLPASYVGLLLDGTGKPALLASSRRQGRQLQVKVLQPLALPAGKVAVLWALPQDGSAAFRVGGLATLGAPGTSQLLPLADKSEALFFKVSRLAVSFEDSGAANAAAPSGEFVFSGHCVKLW